MSEAVASQPRRWWVYLVWALALAVALPPLLALGYWGVHFNRASRQARQLREALAPALDAAQAELARTGRCPPRFEDFHPPAGVRYACAASGDRFWVTFPDQSGMLQPSGLSFEYDSSTRRWELLPLNATQTERDVRARERAQPPAPPPPEGGRGSPR